MMGRELKTTVVKMLFNDMIRSLQSPAELQKVELKQLNVYYEPDAAAKHKDGAKETNKKIVLMVVECKLFWPSEELYSSNLPQHWTVIRFEPLLLKQQRISTVNKLVCCLILPICLNRNMYEDSQ